MYLGKRIAVVLPAYNAAKTLAKTYAEIPLDIVDDVILCDDASKDNTVEKARELGISHVISHAKNRGYGGNQKSLYDYALKQGADIVIMLHPDYQYTPKLLLPMIHIISTELYDVVLGSRILGKGALQGGMPKYKYIANRFLTLTQNVLGGHKLSEYHTGYRAFSRQVLEKIEYQRNSEDFIFDNEMLAQIIVGKWKIAEITCPTSYFKEASSINFQRSVKYGLGVLQVSLWQVLHRMGIYTHPMFRLK
jgi:glycosyltransferase involved in cell wall biosynthesis